MEDLLQIFLGRHSVRRYTDAPISDGALKRILAAGLTSASGKGTQPWEFIVVRDRSMLESLSHCRVGAAKMLAGAACAIVVVGNREKTDTVIEDCSIALANMHLMASAMGIGSCWIQGRLRTTPDGTATEEYLRHLLGFPEVCSLEAILSLGMPEKSAPATDPDSLKWEKVHWEGF